MAFSLDSRWVVVSTLNGTSHAFPITPYGGEPTVRTHISSKVVNRISRFHTSAGIDSIGMNHSHVGAASISKSGQAPPPVNPSSSHFTSTVNGYNNTWSNPRCLPLPNPVSIAALQQIKQPYQSLQGTCVYILLECLLSHTSDVSRFVLKNVSHIIIYIIVCLYIIYIVF